MSTQPIPWSAERETKVRRQIQTIWAEMWISFLLGAVALGSANIYRKPALLLVAGALGGYSVACLLMLQGKRAELGEEMRRLPSGQFYEGSGMLANKPRSTANLTRWIHHPPGEQGFFCECKRKLYGEMAANHEAPLWWSDAQWIPNYDGDPEDIPLGTPMYFDPGGGRYVILCPCGLGHYKLKA